MWYTCFKHCIVKLYIIQYILSKGLEFAHKKIYWPYNFQLIFYLGPREKNWTKSSTSSEKTRVVFTTYISYLILFPTCANSFERFLQQCISLCTYGEHGYTRKYKVPTKNSALSLTFTALKTHLDLFCVACTG